MKSQGEIKMCQENLFSENHIRQINIYNEASKTESKTDGIQGKFTPSQKTAIRAICQEHNIKEGAFLRQAAELYILLFPYRKKVLEHSDVLLDILEKFK